MAATVRVNATGLINKLKALAAVCGKPLREVLDSSGKTFAVTAAYGAVPFGTGDASRRAGENKVLGDIYKVYATPGMAFLDIADNGIAARFWTAYKHADSAAMQDALVNGGTDLRGVRVAVFDGGSAHRAAQDKSTGHVNLRRPVMVVTNEVPLFTYVQTIQKDVGKAKGGFADITRALGSNPRGLKTPGDITANWITRHSRGYGKAYQGGTDANPTLTMVNSVPYASQTLSGAAYDRAKLIALNKTVQYLETVFKQESARLRSAA